MSPSRLAKCFRSSLALILLALATSPLFPAHSAAISTTVVISQVYGSGGVPGAAWQNDYVVLFNNGTAPVNLTGWALQVRPLTGGTWARVPLCGTIAHGHYYLLRLAQGGLSGAPLPVPDCAGPVNLDPAQGVIALTNNENPISATCVSGPGVVDLVGYGTSTSCSETSPGPPTDLVMAIVRKPSCNDTDNNAADFIPMPASPQNQSATNGCNNSAPALSPIPSQTLAEGSVKSFFATATDGDGDPITYGASGPAWVTVIATSGECTLAPDFSAAETNGGIYSAAVLASDGITVTSGGFTIAVTDLTTAANIPYSGSWPGGVDMATNELFLAEPPDLCLGGPLPVCFGRYYASLLDREGVASGHVGTNWLGTFDWRLNVNGATATIVDNRGETLLFTRNATGDWTQANHFEESDKFVIRAFDNMHRLHRGRQRRTYEFDGSTGLLQKVLDEHGNSLTCSYTGGLLSSVSDGLGRILTFSYDANSRLIAVSDGTRYVSYGHAGNLLASFTDAAGHTTTYAYATGPITGLLVSGTTPIGTTPITYAYDADGRVASWTDALSNTWNFGVGPGGGCAVTTPAGDLWESFHGTGLKLESLHDPLGGTTGWTYDTSGRPASMTRPLGDVMTVAYDPPSGFPSDVGRGDETHVFLTYGATLIDGFKVFHLTGISYPDGASESFGYDGAGNLVTHTDRAGEDWTGTYNTRGLLLTRTNPAGGMTTFIYDQLLRPAFRTDNAGNTTAFQYDPLDRLVHVGHPDAAGRDYDYDAVNRLVSMTDEQGKIWGYAYDDHDRLLSQTDPLSHTLGYGYDDMDRVTGVTDALGKTRTYAYDAMGRLASETDRTNRTTMYVYDPLGRLVQRTDPGNTPFQFGYDANGRLRTATDPLGHSMTYEYDALDRVTRATDPLSHAVDCTYDTMGRLTSATAPLGQTRTYGYDPRGLLTSFIDVTSEVQLSRTALGEVGSIGDPNIKVWPFGYDAQGRTISRTDPLARSTSFTYDSRSRLAHVATPVGSGDFTYTPTGDALECLWLDATGSVALSYSYDDARRLTAATGATFGYDAADRLVSSNGLTFTRDDEGRLTSETYAPGKTVTYSYNPRGLLSEVADWLGGTTSFTYDAAGRLTAMTRPNGTGATYEYDAANRLSQLVEQNPGPGQTPLASITLTRDALGRITSAQRDVPLKPTSVVSDVTEYAYDDASQIMGFGYDGLGRLLSDGMRSFNWDAAGRLAHYTAGSDSPYFSYDAFGQMLTRTQGSAALQFVWDYSKGTPMLSKVHSGTTLVQVFVSAPNGLLYKVDGSGKRTFYHYDESGNTVFLTNDAGAVITSYAYTPTGATQGIGYTAENPFTYAGALGVLQEGPDVFSRYGSKVFETRTARCVSCPAEPLATMGAKPGAVLDPGLGFDAGGFGSVVPLAAGGLSGVVAMGALISSGVVPVSPHQPGTIGTLIMWSPSDIPPVDPPQQEHMPLPGMHVSLQAGTFFHVIGHTFGLDHGGGLSGGGEIGGSDASIALDSSGGAEVGGNDATISLTGLSDDNLRDQWEMAGAIDINCDDCDEEDTDVHVYKGECLPCDNLAHIQVYAGTTSHEVGHPIVKHRAVNRAYRPRNPTLFYCPWCSRK